MKFLANFFHRFKDAVWGEHPDPYPSTRESRPETRDSIPVTCQSPPKTLNSKRETQNGLTNGLTKGPQGNHRSKCKVCRHPDRLHIDQALMNGATLESLAKTYGLSVSSFFRHKEHLTARLRQTAKALHETYELDRLLCLARNLHRLEARSELAAAHGDDQNLCRLNREINRNLKAMDALDFRFRNLDEALLFQTVISPDWPDQPTALPTDPAIMAAYRRLLVQGVAESCPPPPQTAKPPPKRPEGAPAPSPVQVEQPPPAVYPGSQINVALPPPAAQDLLPAAASAAGRPRHLPPEEFHRQSRAFIARLKQAAASDLPPAPLNPEVEILHSELETLNPELGFELNSEPKKTTGKQPKNLLLPEALSQHLADITLSQLAETPNTLEFPQPPEAPEKNYPPQAENSPGQPPADPPEASSICRPRTLLNQKRGLWRGTVSFPETPAVRPDSPEPALPSPGQPEATAGNSEFSANHQELTTNNCLHDPWDPAHQANPLWTRPFLTPEEVATLPPTIPQDILDIADIHPIFLKPYLDRQAEHLKGTPFRESPPKPQAPQVEVPEVEQEPQPKPEPTRAEIMADMSRRLHEMLRGEDDEPRGPCRRRRPFSRRGHWDDW